MTYVAQYENFYAGETYYEPKWVWQVRKVNAKGKAGAKLPYVFFKTEAEALRHIEGLQKRADKKALLASLTPEEKEALERIEHAKKIGTPDDPAFECQICGHFHLGYVKHKRLAHHGYQRPGHGYQTQSCYGALMPPLHVSCDALRSYVASLKSLIERKQKALAHVVARPPVDYTVQDIKWAGGRRVSTDRKVERPEDFVAGEVALHHMTEYERCYRKDIREREQEIGSYQHELTYQNAKLVNWKPNPEFKGYYR
jgi:hypothetical protein